MKNVESKEEILKATREKRELIYQVPIIELTVNFSSATIDAKRQWNCIVRVLRANNCEPTILYLAKLSFK